MLLISGCLNVPHLVLYKAKRSLFVFSFFDIHFQKLVCFSLFVFRYSFSEVKLFFDIHFQKLDCFSLFVFRCSLSEVSLFFVIRFSTFGLRATIKFLMSKI